MSLPKTRGRPGELGPGELHPVAGVAGEADRDALELLDVGLELAVGRSSRALRLLHPLVRPGRQVEELLRERLGEVLEDVLLPDDADEDRRRRRRAGRSGSGRSASARSRRGSVSSRWSVCGVGRHQRLDRLGRGRRRPPTSRPKMSRSVRTPRSRPSASHDEDRIAGARPLDRAGGSRRGSCRARTETGSRPLDDLDALVQRGWDALRDGAFGRFSHDRSVGPRRANTRSTLTAAGAGRAAATLAGRVAGPPCVGAGRC